jgi:hypothetical protein
MKQTIEVAVPPTRWHAKPSDMMEWHKFKVDQSVSFMSSPFGRGGTNGLYKVTQLLPPEGDVSIPD